MSNVQQREKIGCKTVQYDYLQAIKSLNCTSDIAQAPAIILWMKKLRFKKEIKDEEDK